MFRSYLVLAVYLTSTACGGPTSAGLQDITGIYNTTTFTVEEGGRTTDQLALGALIATHAQQLSSPPRTAAYPELGPSLA